MTLTFKVKFNFKIKIYPILSLWVCPRDKSPLVEGFPNLDQKCILVQLGSLLILGLIDLDLQLYFYFQTSYFLQTSRLLLICVVLYIFSEAIATDCSTSHMAQHIYWFLCMRAGSRHGPWNSLPLYLGETIGVQPASTRQLALDFTSCYWFSPYHIWLACRNFICQH